MYMKILNIITLNGNKLAQHPDNITLYTLALSSLPLYLVHPMYIVQYWPDIVIAREIGRIIPIFSVLMYVTMWPILFSMCRTSVRKSVTITLSKGVVAMFWGLKWRVIGFIIHMLNKQQFFCIWINVSFQILQIS